jgi:hypothetical protein
MLIIYNKIRGALFKNNEKTLLYEAGAAATLCGL